MDSLQNWKMTDTENLHNLSDRLEGSASIFVLLLPENQQIFLQPFPLFQCHMVMAVKKLA